MCGITGLWHMDASRTVSPVLLQTMTMTLRHRGPDGYGFYADPDVGLAHVRLSIIDLAGGAQPLTNEDGSLVITYNGEVYNYVELAAELASAGHRFRTRCDTEVLVHAWEEWGPRMFERLNGQFAFALYDRRTHTAVLARDRFGVRPLYYAQVRGGLALSAVSTPHVAQIQTMGPPWLNSRQGGRSISGQVDRTSPSQNHRHES